MAHLNTIEPPAPPDNTSASPAAAAQRAAAHLAANLAALAETQPRLAQAVGPALPDLEFVFGRDGYLTGFDGEGRWWSGCSLPQRANAAMLRALKVNGPVSCFLAPPHAASLRVALETTPAAHAIVALAPDRFALCLLLACDDFSAAIRQHRLWFAWGECWAAELESLFDERPGLPTPTQFIRLPVTEQETVERMIKAAQGVFAALLLRRSALAREMRDAWRPASREATAVCVLTSRQFALWNDAAFTLGAALMENHHGDTEGAVKIVPVQLDEPLNGSPLAMLSAAVECDAMVTADVARADMPDLLPKELPWVTWVTRPRIPAFAAAGPKDALLVADASWKRLAVDAGWPADRVELARWPDLATVWAVDAGSGNETAEIISAEDPLFGRNSSGSPGAMVKRTRLTVEAPVDARNHGQAGTLDHGTHSGRSGNHRLLAGLICEARAVCDADGPTTHASQAGPLNGSSRATSAQKTPGGLAIIAATWPLGPPERLDDFSSQRLLWNSIRRELEAEPLILAGVDPGDYLDERLTQFSVSGEGLDRGLFVERLIVACYGQGIGRLLLGAGLPLRLFGAGWGDLPEFAPHAGGPVRSRAALKQAMAGAAALVHVWPMTHAHPIESAGRPVVRPLNRRTDTFIRAAVDALKPAASRGMAGPLCSSVLSIESISIIRTCR